jgi:hypothetical protein
VNISFETLRQFSGNVGVFIIWIDLHSGLLTKLTRR